MSAEETTGLTVIVLAAGGGTRMKSKTMKVLHPVAGRSMVGHVLAAVAGRCEPRRIVAVVGHQRDQVGPHIQALVPGRRCSPCRRSSTAPATPSGSRWTRWPAAASVAGAPCWWRTPTPRCSRRESLRDLRRRARGRPAGGQHPVRRGGRPVRLRPGGPQRRGRRRGDRRGEGRDRRAARRSARSTPGSSPSTRRSCVDALPRLTNDNAKGEYYLTDTVAHRPRGRAARRRPRDRRRHADRGRQRPGPAGPDRAGR